MSEIRCDCGRACASVAAPPLFRVVCHCTLCQRYNAAPYGDVALYHAADVRVADDASVDFRAWKWPPLVRRGTCTACGAAAWEHIRVPALPALIGIPAGNVRSPESLPPPAAQIYAESRIAESASAPATACSVHRGALSSNLVWGRLLLAGLRARRRAA